MNQSDLSTALVVGRILRLRLSDGRTLQGVLEEVQIGGEGEATSLKFRPLFGVEPKTHSIGRPEDVMSIEAVTTAG